MFGGGLQAWHGEVNEERPYRTNGVIPTVPCPARRNGGDATFSFNLLKWGALS
jgi:hypothetical protein